MDEIKRPWRSTLMPIDLITCVYLLASGCLAGLWGKSVPGALWLCPLFIAGGLATLVFPPLLRGSRSSLLHFLADWYPIFGFTFFYLSTGLLNQGSPIPCLDPWLAEWDRALFGRIFCEGFSEAFSTRVFAEIMAFFYFSYYFMIPGLGLVLWFRDRLLFRRFLFCTALGFYFFYLLFSILPSYGPQFHVNHGAIFWDGYLFGPLLTGLLLGIEMPTGAFPSSHVGVSVVVTVFAWRHSRRLGALAAILLAGLSLSILYGGPHYFIDLPCGIALGLCFLLLHQPVALKIHGWLGTRPGKPLCGLEAENPETNADLR
ncbi:MAG: phosphatase PAP2 family protein [Planctomycetota bacterium]|jgi:hypothetical protein